jgi:hypothetical protein
MNYDLSKLWPIVIKNSQPFINVICVLTWLPTQALTNTSASSG